MIVRNVKALATTPLRKDAVTILEAGYQSIQTPKIIGESVSLNGSMLVVEGREYNLDDFENIFLVGIGKCALDSCAKLEDILGDRITDGIVLDVRGGTLKNLKSHEGTHPYPSEKNIEVAESIAGLLEKADEKDLVITIVSGGGSALLCLPNDLGCEEMISITKALMNASATIHELNVVRKHTSRIQGGQFAKLAYPATVISLIFSDVPGDDIGTIASGPTVKDASTADDAAAILAKYNVINVCKLPGCDLVETPKEDKYFEKVHNILVLNNEVALQAMLEKAEELGYASKIENTKIEGDVHAVAAKMVDRLGETKECHLYGGETTMFVHHAREKGGRNQELGLTAMMLVPDGAVVVAAASDGCDNSEVAGVIVDSETRKRGIEMNLDAQEYLEQDNSYEFFQHVGDYIETGKTGVNVSDLYFTLHE